MGTVVRQVPVPLCKSLSGNAGLCSSVSAGTARKVTQIAKRLQRVTRIDGGCEDRRAT